MRIRFRSQEEENVIDIRKHQLKLAKLEVIKIKASRKRSAEDIGVIAIRWSALLCVCGIASLTICALKPVDIEVLKENHRFRDNPTAYSSNARDQIAITLSKADSIAKIKAPYGYLPEVNSQSINVIK